MTKTDLRLVEVVERRYKRKWVRVRGVRFYKWPIEKSGKYITKLVIEGRVEGISKNGYGKIMKGGYRVIEGAKSYGVRYKLGDEYKEVTEEDLCDLAEWGDERIYRSLDVERVLTGKRADDGLEYKEENWKKENPNTIVLRKDTKVLTRDCFDYLVESNEVEIDLGGVLVIDKGVSLKGVTVDDLICLPVPKISNINYKITVDLYITEEHAKEIEWGELEEYEWDDWWECGVKFKWWYVKIGVVGTEQLYVIGLERAERGRVVKINKGFKCKFPWDKN